MKARGRQWIVLPDSTDQILKVRPMGGLDDEVVGIHRALGPQECRFLLRCELDAAYFHLYLGSPVEWGTDSPQLREVYPTPRHAVEYIMETFPIVKRRDIKRTEVLNDQGEVATEGTYITKDTILTIYDAMQTAIDTGTPYQTRLDPPPADPRVAHPARSHS